MNDSVSLAGGNKGPLLRLPSAPTNQHRIIPMPVTRGVVVKERGERRGREGVGGVKERRREVSERGKERGEGGRGGGQGVNIGYVDRVCG